MKPAAHIANNIRGVLKDGGSATHAAGVQWFFKEQIKSHGWHTNDLRKLAGRFRRKILSEGGLPYLLAIADDLFTSRVLEEKVCAVFLLQKSVKEFGDKEFKLLESWISRVSSWADHDALASFLLGPMVAAEPKRLKRVFHWAGLRTKPENRWHRRAACVALIRGTREHMFFDEIVRLSDQLLTDQDDMVQKGLGWLLRETAKANPKPTTKYLMTIRKHAPRLVLRTACETLPVVERLRVLARPRPVAR